MQSAGRARNKIAAEGGEKRGIKEKDSTTSFCFARDSDNKSIRQKRTHVPYPELGRDHRQAPLPVAVGGVELVHLKTDNKKRKIKHARGTHTKNKKI